MQLKDKIRAVSDLAFDAVDADNSNSLDDSEIAKIMKEVGEEMKIMPPTEPDIALVL